MKKICTIFVTILMLATIFGNYNFIKAESNEEPNTIEYTPPKSILSLDFKTIGDLELNKDIYVVLEASSLSYISNARIDINLPRSIELIEGELHWYGEITKSSTIQIPLKIKLYEEKDYELYATITDEDGFVKEKHASYYFSVSNGVVDGSDNLMSFIDIDEETGNVCIQATKIEGEEYVSTTKNSEPLAGGSQDTVSLSSRWLYYNEFEGISGVPFMFVIAELYKTSSIDEEEPEEEYVTSSYTDAEGRVEFNNLEPGQYYIIKVYAETSSDSGHDAAWITVPGNNVPIQLSSEWMKLDEDRTIVYNTDEVAGKAFFLLNYVTCAYDWLKEETGWSRNKIRIEWPAEYSGFSHVPGDNIEFIRISGQNTLTEGPYAILHEYSHAIMFSAYGNDMPDHNGPYSPHYLYSETDPGFAVVEGWAEFLPYLFDIPEIVDQYFIKFYDLESRYDADYLDDGWEDVAMGVSGDGVIIEGAVAGTLWDLFDGESNTDYPSWSDIEIGDYVSDEFSKIWTIILNDNPDHIMDFWDCWKNRFGVNTDIWSIFYHQRMDFPHTIEEYTFTINIQGEGTVTKDPEQTKYTHGTFVALSANPEKKWLFDHWEGDMTGKENPNTIRMDGNKIITAFFTEEENNPPNTPYVYFGREGGRTNTSYEYIAVTTDPDEDKVKIKFDWDDGTNSAWTYLVNSGCPASKTKSWDEEGTYKVKVKAKDEYGAETDWLPAIDVIIDNKKSYLECSGDLIFSNKVEPESIIYGSFYVENTGECDSYLNWEVYESSMYIDESPDCDYNLKPSEGKTEVDVTIYVPDRKNKEYNYQIKVRNMDNHSNQDIINVEFTTNTGEETDPAYLTNCIPEEQTITVEEGETVTFSGWAFEGSGEYEFIFDVGETTVTKTDNEDNGYEEYTHTYTQAGTYTTSISLKDQETGMTTDTKTTSTITVAANNNQNNPI